MHPEKGAPAMNEYLIVSDEVRDAIEKDLPVVAFETSILTHGLPQPHNVDLAKEVEAIARSMGSFLPQPQLSAAS